MKKKILFAVAVLGAAGAMTAALTANALQPLTNAEAEEYSITLDNAFAKTIQVDKDDQFVDGFTYQTANGSNIKFNSELMFLPPDGWGGFTANCWTHSIANFYNVTPITGIKSVMVHGWFIGGDTTHIRVVTASNSTFTEDVTTYYLNKGTGTAATLGEVFNLSLPDSPSFIKFLPTEGVNQIVDFYKVQIKYSCAAAENKMNHRIKQVGDKCTATGMDGTGWSNFDASYKFFGVYDDTAIVSANLDTIEHDNRAYHGLMVSDGSKLDASKGAETQRNFKAYQLGLAKKGFYSCQDLNGNRGRDASNPNYYPETTVGTSGKMTIVLKNNTLYLYINDNYINCKSITAVDPVGGFASGAKLMFGVWFHNYYDASRSVTMVDQIYGAEAVNAEIATNDVYSNLR